MNGETAWVRQLEMNRSSCQIEAAGRQRVTTLSLAGGGKLKCATDYLAVNVAVVVAGDGYNRPLA